MDKGDPKIHLLQISQALDLTTLKFNDVLTINFHEIQSNGERRFERRFSGCKIGHVVRSLDENSIKEAALIKPIVK